MIDGIHFLLSYTCNFECDHCFLFCSPRAKGTFTIGQVDQVLEEAVKIGSIEWIYYEGGEPFLYHPLLLESVRRARARGFKVGIVSNGFGAHSEEDAELYLKPLAEQGLSFLSVSDDTYHYGDESESPAKVMISVAENLGIDTAPICIDPPKLIPGSLEEKGEPVIGGSARFRGRAAEKLTNGFPLRKPETLNECPYEDLESPSRVHVDYYGNVHLCQGLSMGNMWETPLNELVRNYDPREHPFCAPLLKGGPYELARSFDVKHDAGYVDECHFCYYVRKALLKAHPDYLTPEQVYGLGSDNIDS